MTERFAGQAAIVTGAASGIGRETALRLARDGADVLAADRDGDGAEETARRGNGPGRIAMLEADITADDSPARIVAACRERFGAPRILVNNAGIGDARAAHLTDDAALDRYLDVNLRALFRLSRESVAAMTAASGGAIVNIASIFGVTGFRGSSAYSATKAAAIGLTRNMAADYGHPRRPRERRCAGNHRHPADPRANCRQPLVRRRADRRHPARPRRQAGRSRGGCELPVLGRRLVRQRPRSGGGRRFRLDALSPPPRRPGVRPKASASSV